MSEVLTFQEVRDHCRIDQVNSEPAPGSFTVALASPAAGNVNAGAHRYLSTFVTADGETEAGIPSSVVTVADAGVNGQVSLTGIPLGGAAVTSRKIYRTTAGGTAYYLLATIANNTATTYTDNIADGSLGVGAPTTNTTGDPWITMMIRSATKTAESITRKVMLTASLTHVLDCWPAVIYLPKSPVQSVTSITYVDENGATQTLASDQYRTDLVSEPARITPAYDVTWPTIRNVTNAVTVTYVAGYGAAADIPAGIKNWMLVRIKHYWDNRGPVVTGNSVEEFPRSYVDGLLDDYAAPSFSWMGQ
jgi:uncharacterized phiE125 gp8 family phage protein